MELIYCSISSCRVIQYSNHCDIVSKDCSNFVNLSCSTLKKKKHHLRPVSLSLKEGFVMMMFVKMVFILGPLKTYI